MSFLGGNITYKKNGKTYYYDFTKSGETEDFVLSYGVQAFTKGSAAQLTLKAKNTVTLLSASLMTNEKIKPEAKVFLNGYQTWTDSREFSLDEKIPKLSPLVKPIMSMYGDYNFVKSSRDKLQSFTYTYIRNEKNKLRLYGSLNEKDGYTVFIYSKKAKNLEIFKDCRGLELGVGVPYHVFGIYSLEGEDNDVFDKYFECANIKKPKSPPCTGWTSWYNYYTAVKETDIDDNLKAFKKNDLPIDIFQIDDGYQNAVGDWLLINNKFPSGMAAVADKIHQNGCKAGLWLAPIICEKKSELYKQHPSWVTVKAGFNPGWSGIFYALDFYNPEVREYLRMVFNTVLNVWHYDMVKLDFLYAACLTVPKDKTRGQVMFEFMSFLREISGDKIILGCGVPLGCAFGLVDYCRVSSDVALKWEDKMLKNLHYRERVSTINALTSTIGRSHLNGRAFYNDPDVFILRKTNNELTDDQRYTLFMINAVLGGLVFTSDNVNEYSQHELDLFKSLFSLKDANVISVNRGDILTVDYKIGEKECRLYSNLTESPKAAVSTFTGTADGNEIKAGEKITLRPYMSLNIECK